MIWNIFVNESRIVSILTFFVVIISPTLFWMNLDPKKPYGTSPETVINDKPIKTSGNNSV